MNGGLRSPCLGAIASRNYAGARGIKNLGNTCFLNVVLQSLMSLRSFHTYLNSGEAITSTGTLTRALRASFEDLSRPVSSPYDPTPMIKRVPVLQSTFAQGQHDPEELLHHLMTILDEETAPAKEAGKAKEATPASYATTQSSIEKEWDDVGEPTSRRENPFAGRLVSKISCTRCKQERTQTHSFIDLSLAIPSGTTTTRPMLENCLDLFTKAEKLAGVRCDRCIEHRREQRRHAVDCLSKSTAKSQLKLTHNLSQSRPSAELAALMATSDVIELKQLGVDRWSAVVEEVLSAQKKLSIAKSPRALCLHIQRLVAQPGFRDTTFVKRTEKVTLPVKLEIGPYCEQPEKSIAYILAAVIVHHGSEDGGHFTVFRRLIHDAEKENYAQFLQRAGRTSGTSISEESYWVRVSDEICQHVEEDEVLDSEAYMLFYEKPSAQSSS